MAKKIKSKFKIGDNVKYNQAYLDNAAAMLSNPLFIENYGLETMLRLSKNDKDIRVIESIYDLQGDIMYKFIGHKKSAHELSLELV